MHASFFYRKKCPCKFTALAFLEISNLNQIKMINLLKKNVQLSNGLFVVEVHKNNLKSMYKYVGSIMFEYVQRVL